MYIKKNFNAAFGWEETNKKKRRHIAEGKARKKKKVKS